MNSKKYNFRYRNPKAYKKTLPLFFILFILILIVLYKEIYILYLFIPAVIAVAILLTLWLYYIKCKSGIRKGSFEFHDKDFYYTTKGKTIAIDYKEISSVEKETFQDKFLIFKKEAYRYTIKIINAGTFYFPYYDTNLETAIGILKTKI